MEGMGNMKVSRYERIVPLSYSCTSGICVPALAEFALAVPEALEASHISSPRMVELLMI